MCPLGEGDLVLGSSSRVLGAQVGPGDLLAFETDGHIRKADWGDLSHCLIAVWPWAGQSTSLGLRFHTHEGTDETCHSNYSS